jgi:hypothetical protein
VTRDVQPIWKNPAKPKPKRRSLNRKRKPHSQPRPVAPWSTDADYETARTIVMERAGGMCEHCRTEPATNVHHKAGRGFPGCHHPLLLLALCGMGNASGCHGKAHSIGLSTAMALGLRLPKGTTVDDLRGAS